jgi:hypothetical protein
VLNVTEHHDLVEADPLTRRRGNADWALASSTMDENGMPAERFGPQCPAGLKRKGALAPQQRPVRGREARTQPEDDDDGVPVWKCADDKAPASSTHHERARLSNREPGELPKEDGAVRARNLDIERIETTRVIDGFALEIDQTRAEGAWKPTDELVQDRRKRAGLGIARGNGAGAFHPRPPELWPPKVWSEGCALMA